MNLIRTRQDAPNVLVTDAENRSVVAACRGLDATGFAVAAAAGERPAAAHWSRSCKERLVVAHPLDDPEGFAGDIRRLVTGGRYAAIVPGSDASLVSLSEHRDTLEPHVALGLPAGDGVARSLDKLVLAEAASAAGLPAPDSELCPGREAALAAAHRFGFPVVLKAARAVFQLGGARRPGSVRVSDGESLVRLLPRYGNPCMVQRAEAGPILSFGGVLAGGRLLGTAVSRYLRTWYPEAGNVSFSETVEPPRGLSDRIVTLLSIVGWEGIFEVELIARPDGSLSTIDLNPRVYGSLALAIAAGANLPALWCRWLVGGDPNPEVARPGVRYRWEDADMRHFLWQARRRRIGAAARVLRPRRRTVHPHFRLKDPGPLAARALALARTAAGRRPPEVAILGAGPYGLAAAAHLRHAGVRVRVFGEPLEFWRTQMPKGMILRSRIRSSHISDPERALTIRSFEAAQGRKVTSPSLRLEEFIDYGRWFQSRAVPDVDRRRVRLLERDDGRFRFVLEDGEEVTVDRAVVAGGLFPFARRPEPFASLPSSLVSHSSEHEDLGRFSGARVLVVGAGQSALESAALLSEAGARVEMLARTPQLYWLADGPDAPQPRTLRSRLPLPPTDVGGFATGWAAAIPDLYRHVPGRLKPVVSFRCIRPAGSGWLRPRLEGVPIECERTAVAAAPANSGVRVSLSDGSERTADHVLLGTGYQIDVRRYPFLGGDLARSIEVADGYPLLGPGLESSVPGLHFMGAPAAISFGPIMRFVVGTWYAAPALAARIHGRRQRPLRRSF
jgi:FAD-dependent urate hydroxylase